MRVAGVGYMYGEAPSDMTSEETAALREDMRILALCEDPNEDFDDIESRPPTPDEVALVGAMGADLFYGLPPEEQVDDILHLPPHVSARLLARMPSEERDRILPLLPGRLSETILSLLPVGSA